MRIERNGNQVRCLDYNSENCIGCGICVDICPTNSLKLGPVLPIARGLLKMDYVSVNEDTCALCGLCASACAFKAMKCSINGEDMAKMEVYPKWSHETVVNDDACAYCRKCESVCPRDAITVTRTLPKRSDLVIGEIEIKEDECINCGICEEMCPAEAIKIKETGKNSYSISVDEDKCVYCLVCKRACPENAIKAACRLCSYGEYELDPEKYSVTGKLILDEEDCIKCGWCEDICPKEAVTVIKAFEGEISTGNTECKGDSCHACHDVCPCNAITVVNGEAHVNPDHCILCGVCTNVCPQQNIVIKRNNMNLENVRSKSWDKILSNLTE
ncbi:MULTISPECIES: tungsten-dependent formylmethanofuran dehydrogenase subunit FwdF [Methanobacterium]|uniref:4Fe-4S binding protein n=1 Tax=Methanobacterium veterum TaxID=408577 RepID=A0A9E5DJK5_9EURY|nr:MULTISPECIES: tungsten-dependent formylmethanofuran dehydrogenase subunit FwdF [Methanobacterium]MCZ3365308.1 4Fe-4S binding protein [Methanobacterium veterum]MCZ3373059.1 4Fe-4S binding protein [Methanobacterium veterum]